MKLVNFKAPISREAVMNALVDDVGTNQNVKFEKLSGKPKFHIKDKGRSVKIKCELMRVSSSKKDNGFIFGTSFYGKIIEKNGITSVKGLITTELIFHTIFVALLASFIVQCFYSKGFSIIPMCLVVFDIFMFREEFRKQGIIKRYIARSLRRAVAENRSDAKSEQSE